MSQASASAAAQRQRRARAALALDATPRRAQLGWADLAAWPAWADASAAERERCLWRAGAWHAAASLRHCIDGQVMKRLADGLGAPALARLLTADPAAPADAAPVAWNLATLDAELLHYGRECALAALPSAALRVVLRERLWPDSVAPVPAVNTGQALRAMQQAVAAP